MFPCPVCGGDSIHIPVYKHNWAVCETCRLRWYEGYGLISLPEEYCAEMWEKDFREQKEELLRYTLVADEGSSLRSEWGAKERKARHAGYREGRRGEGRWER